MTDRYFDYIYDEDMNYDDPMDYPRPQTRDYMDYCYTYRHNGASYPEVEDERRYGE